MIALTPGYRGPILAPKIRRRVTSRERLEGFLSHSPIDRVPVQLQNMVLAAQSTGLDFPLVYRNPDLVVQGHIGEWEKYRHDGVIVDVGTHAAAEAVGCRVEYAPGNSRG